MDALASLQFPPDYPWSAQLSLALATLFIDLSLGPNGTVHRSFDILDFKDPPPEQPVNNGVTSYDVTVDSSRNLWFRVYTPVNSTTAGESLPVVMFFHGGGFALLGPGSKLPNSFCQRLAREIPAVVVSVNYRLSPEHRYPSQYKDGFEALKFLDTKNVENFPKNADLGRCFLAGESAGGNLAHHLALRVGKSESDFQRVKVKGLIAIQPFYGGEERTKAELRLTNVPMLSMKITDWMWETFLPKGSNRDHPAANVFGPNAEDISRAKFPPTILFIGDYDPLQDWQKRYYKGLKKSGKEVSVFEYKNAVHSFHSFPELPQSSKLMKEVKEFMRKQCAK